MSAFSELEKQFQAFVEVHKIPGAVLGITYQDESAVFATGITHVDHPLPVNKDTLFQIGSISKTFTALLGMRLIEEGLLKLDEPITGYLADTPLEELAIMQGVTLRNLFQHNAGWIGDWFPGLWHGEDAIARYAYSMIANRRLTPLGQVYSYNNAGFAIAGFIYETVTGQSFPDLMQQMLFIPMGLHRTYYRPWDVMMQRIASGHDVREGEAFALPIWSIGLSSAPKGGIISTAGDLQTYGQFWLAGGITRSGEQLISPESLKAMFELIPIGIIPERIGLAWFGHDLYSQRIYYHGGQTVGQTARLTLVPDSDMVIACLTNSNRGGMLNEQITDWALRNIGGLDREPLPVVEMAAEALDEYAGEYDAQLTAVRLERQGDQLLLWLHNKGGFPVQNTPPAVPDPTEPMQLAFFTPDGAYILDGPDARAEFIRDENGQIAWFRVFGRIHRRL